MFSEVIFKYSPPGGTPSLKVKEFFDMVSQHYSFLQFEMQYFIVRAKAKSSMYMMIS